jgi:transcriptional regulator with XRE-family HTH domain
VVTERSEIGTTSPGVSTLPVVIKERRLALGFTQADVAHFLGVSQGAIARWERGSRAPGGEHLLKLQRLLGFTPRQVA